MAKRKSGNKGKQSLPPAKRVKGGVKAFGGESSQQQMTQNGPNINSKVINHTKITPNSESPNSESRLLKIPSELRIMIYELLIDSQSHYLRLDSRPPWFRQPLFLVSRQIRDEAFDVFYKKNKVKLRITGSFTLSTTRTLEEKSDHFRKALTKITLNDFSSVHDKRIDLGKKRVMNCLLTCTNLTKLIWKPFCDFPRHDENRFVKYWNVARRSSIPALLQLPKLRYVSIWVERSWADKQQIIFVRDDETSRWIHPEEYTMSLYDFRAKYRAYPKAGKSA